MSPQMEADILRWEQKKRERAEAQAAKGKAVGTFDEIREQLKQAVAQLPEKPDIPFNRTRRGERWFKFAAVCDEEFRKKIDRAQLANPAAHDAVTAWNGSYPGICAVGGTSTGKTRAAWVALSRLYVHDEELTKAFAWFPARQLVARLERYEEQGSAEEFFRMYDFFQVLFVDDADKINWNFDSHKAALFAFYDWVYRRQKPVITTTNKDRAWWVGKMGEAFARRMFEDAHRVVQF